MTDFAVTVDLSGATGTGSVSGGRYYEGDQPGTGFNWDGTAATIFFRNGGTLTNGARYYLVTNPGISVAFGPGETIIFAASVGGSRTYSSTLAPIPEPAATVLTLAGLCGVMTLVRRRC